MRQYTNGVQYYPNYKTVIMFGLVGMLTELSNLYCSSHGGRGHSTLNYTWQWKISKHVLPFVVVELKVLTGL